MRSLTFPHVLSMDTQHLSFVELVDAAIVQKEEGLAFLEQMASDLVQVASGVFETASAITKLQFQEAVGRKIQEYFPLLEAKAKKASHGAAQLPAALNNFEVLSSCIADINGEDMRAMELAVQKDPTDKSAQADLKNRADAMVVRYSAEVNSRIAQPGLTKLVVESCQEGNDAFRKVYDIIWDQTIARLETEKAAIQQHALLMDDIRKATRAPSIKKQPTSSLVDLYVQAAMIKDQFDKVVVSVGKQFEVERNKTLALSICVLLKKISRMVEKGQLKAKAGDDNAQIDPGEDVSGVKDIVRAMVTADTMEEVNAVIHTFVLGLVV